MPQTHNLPLLPLFHCTAIIDGNSNWRLDPFLRLFASQPFEEKQQHDHDCGYRDQPQAAPAPMLLLHNSSPNPWLCKQLSGKA
jgi:hypothetical protein